MEGKGKFALEETVPIWYLFRWQWISELEA